MPNHVYTNLEVIGSDSDIAAFKARFCDKINDQEDCLIFNRVIPMPEELNIESSSESSMGYTAVNGDYKAIFDYPWVVKLMLDEHLSPTKINAMKSSRPKFIAWFEKHRPDAIALGRQVLSNVEKYGYKTWYEWRIEKWGTKWDAYEHRVGEPDTCSYVTYFETAWSPAIPVLEAMSHAFPELNFRMAYADEGGGFAGVAHALDGEVTDSDEDYRAICINEFGYVASDFEDEEDDAGEVAADGGGYA